MADVQVTKKAKVEERPAETIPSRIQWVSVKTNTNKESAQFYEKVLGWKPQETPQSDLWMEVKRPEPNGTNIALRPASRFTTHEAKAGQVGLTLVVKDLTKFHEYIKDTEGLKVVQAPTKEPWGGFMAVYFSPDETEFNVIEEWEYSTEPKGTKSEGCANAEKVEKVAQEEKKEDEATPIGNGICFLEVPCADFARAEKFFTSAFGWSFSKREGMTFFKTNDPQNGLSGKLTQCENRILGGYLSILATDMDEFMEKVKANGGSVVKEWTPLPRMAAGEHAVGTIKDTEGNEWGVYFYSNNVNNKKRKNSEEASA